VWPSSDGVAEIRWWSGEGEEWKMVESEPGTWWPVLEHPARAHRCRPAAPRIGWASEAAAGWWRPLSWAD